MEDELTRARERVTLLELVDRALDKGVVISGDITLSVANVDLVYVGLRAVLGSVASLAEPATTTEDELTARGIRTRSALRVEDGERASPVRDH